MAGKPQGVKKVRKFNSRVTGTRSEPTARARHLRLILFFRRSQQADRSRCYNLLVPTLERRISNSAETVLREALQLSSIDRAALVEGLIASLDKPDTNLDARWLSEAEDRMAAYRSGELAAADADTVFADLGGRV